MIALRQAEHLDRTDRDDSKIGHHALHSKRVRPRPIGFGLAGSVMHLIGVILALLCFAAWRDVTTRTIPDAVSIGIVLVGALMRLSEGWEALAISAAVAAALFLALVPFHARGFVGGGDIKLLAALTLGLSPAMTYQMLSATTFAGGILALVYVCLRAILRRRDPAPAKTGTHHNFFRRFLTIELWRIRRGSPLPYALAIAAGASLVLSRQGA